MRASNTWARVKPSGAHMLRRGAWYPVVNDKQTGMVILDIAKKTVPVPRDLVEIRSTPPERFSVVMRAPTDPNPVEGTERDLGPTYAVCPRTRQRVGLTGNPDTMLCPVCHEEHPVEWGDPC